MHAATLKNMAVSGAAKSIARAYLMEKECQILADIKSGPERERAIQECLFTNQLVKNTVKARQKEFENIIKSSKGMCLIEVSLELELEKRDMEDALEVGDPNQLVKIFPALSKHNAQTMLRVIKEKKFYFEGLFAKGQPGVVELNYSGYGMHCGEGWILTDQRLLQNVTQIQNATFTFLVGEGSEKREVKFEPVERFAFHMFVKPSERKKCSGCHPDIAFVKLGLQSEEGRPKSYIQEWETAEQALLDELKLPEFRLPLFNDLDLTKKYTIVEFLKTEEETQRIVSFIQDMDIVASTDNNNTMFRMQVNRLENYMPKSGGFVFSQDGDLFTLCGMIFNRNDSLLLDREADNPPIGEILPLNGETLTQFNHAKNFVYNRTGQSLTDGSSISFNYQMMAEFSKDLLVKSLGKSFGIDFVYPYLEEQFSQAHTIDAIGYFEKEIEKEMKKQPNVIEFTLPPGLGPLGGGGDKKEFSPAASTSSGKSDG